MYLTARVRLALYQIGIEKTPFESGHDVAAGPGSHIYRLKQTHSICVLLYLLLFTTAQFPAKWIYRQTYVSHPGLCKII